MGFGFGSSSLRLCDFVICTLIKGKTECKDYIGKGHMFDQGFLDPKLDVTNDVTVVPGNYTEYIEDQYWAPIIYRKAITDDKTEDMHFGAGNEYNVWSFYGKIDENGKFVHPHEDGHISKDFIMFYLAESDNSFVRFFYLLALFFANV